MTNENKQSIIDAIDTAGYTFTVSENDPQPVIEGDKIVITEVVTFVAKKRIEIPKPE